MEHQHSLPVSGNSINDNKQTQQMFSFMNVLLKVEQTIKVVFWFLCLVAEEREKDCFQFVSIQKLLFSRKTLHRKSHKKFNERKISLNCGFTI